MEISRSWQTVDLGRFLGNRRSTSIWGLIGGCGESFLPRFALSVLYAHMVTCYIRWLEDMVFAQQAPSTFFLGNRPRLELIRRLIEQRAKTDTLRVAVLGCSIGVEAYSVAWRIRSARPDLKLMLHALDISKWAVEFGKCGRYSLVASQSTDTDIFQRMTEREITELFDRDGDVV